MKFKAKTELAKLLGENTNILDKELFEILINGIINAPDDEKILWAAFINVFKEVKSIDYETYVKFQFYFTGEEDNHRLMILLLLHDLPYKTKELERLFDLIKNF